MEGAAGGEMAADDGGRGGGRQSAATWKANALSNRTLPKSARSTATASNVTRPASRCPRFRSRAAAIIFSERSAKLLRVQPSRLEPRPQEQ